MPNPTKIVNQSIVLANLPVSPTDAANKQYVDNIYNAAIANSGNPGIIGYFATSSAPTGWVKANGAVLPIASYQALFDVLPKQGNGNTIWWQAGDGPLNFRIPDLRGVFPRGWDDGRGVDSGRGFGTDQNDALGNHTHGGQASASTSITATPGNGGTFNTGGIFMSSSRRTATPTTDSINGVAAGTNFSDGTSSSVTRGALGASTTVGLTINNTGSTETRPRNLSLLACIKF